MLVFDLETNGLLPELSLIHCISIYDSETKTYEIYDQTTERIREGLERLRTAECICGHNIIGFDIPAIKKLVPGWQPRGEVIDTLVLSRMLFGDIRETDFGRWQRGELPGSLIGKQSLEAWGYRLGVLKGDYGKTTTWERWTPEMSEYCEQDVRVTVRLYSFCASKEPSKQAVELEHRVASIIQQQEAFGFAFDVQAAERLEQRLRVRHAELVEQLQKQFPPFYVPVSKKPFIPKRNNARLGYYKGAGMTKIDLVDFKANSAQHVAYVLKKKFNWEPKEFTPKSNEPKITEDILATLEYPGIDAIREYWIVTSRLAQLADGKQAWMKCVGPDGRIHGGVNSCGAVTARMTHFKPNVAQVPANRVPYGEDCRALFVAGPGKVLVGIDASGLEARCLAHFLAYYDNGAFAKAVLEGSKEDGTDIHSVNARALDCDRDTAKTWFYAWMYGAGSKKQADILGVTLPQARKKEKAFYAALPAIAKLKEAVGNAAERGFLWGLDQRKIPVRSKHAALNTLLQSAGALIMKKALVLLVDRFEDDGFTDYGMSANIHDEWQIVTLPEHGEYVGKAAVNAMERAGEAFEFKCPITGEYSIGKNWKETH